MLNNLLTMSWDLLMQIWENGTWLGVSAFALLMLLAWFVMGADFKFRNKKEIITVAAFAFLTIFPLVWSLEIQPIQVKIALKSLLPPMDSVIYNQNITSLSANQTQNLKPNKSEFNLLSVVTPVVALFLSLFPFLIAKIFREHTSELRSEIKSASSIKIVALNSKCYSYFNRHLNQQPSNERGQIKRAEFGRIVTFFEADFENDEKILLEFIGIEDDDKTLLHKIPESRQYLNALQNYYADKYKETSNNRYNEIESQCKRLLN